MIQEKHKRRHKNFTFKLILTITDKTDYDQVVLAQEWIQTINCLPRANKVHTGKVTFKSGVNQGEKILKS